MTLTEAGLIQAIAEETGTIKKEATEMIEALFEMIKSTLENGEDVMISGFGKFSAREKNQRRGRNPATGNDLMLDGRRIVTFTCSGVLRDKLNSQKERDANGQGHWKF